MKYDEFLKKESQKKGRSKPRHIESQIQIQMVKWFRLQYPRYIIAAIPNGGQRSALESEKEKDKAISISDISDDDKKKLLEKYLGETQNAENISKTEENDDNKRARAQENDEN